MKTVGYKRADGAGPISFRQTHAPSPKLLGWRRALVVSCSLRPLVLATMGLHGACEQHRYAGSSPDNLIINSGKHPLLY